MRKAFREIGDFFYNGEKKSDKHFYQFNATTIL